MRSAVRSIGIFRLGGKGVILKPVEQLRAPAGNDLNLREVQMGVDEAGHQQSRTVIDDVCGLRKLWPDLEECATGGDDAIIDDQSPVLDIEVSTFVVWALRFRHEGQDPSAQAIFEPWETLSAVRVGLKTKPAVRAGPPGSMPNSV